MRKLILMSLCVLFMASTSVFGYQVTGRVFVRSQDGRSRVAIALGRTSHDWIRHIPRCGGVRPEHSPHPFHHGGGIHGAISFRCV